jgi:hypothetical protein
VLFVVFDRANDDGESKAPEAGAVAARSTASGMATAMGTTSAHCLRVSSRSSRCGSMTYSTSNCILEIIPLIIQLGTNVIFLICFSILFAGLFSNEYFRNYISRHCAHIYKFCVRSIQAR